MKNITRFIKSKVRNHIVNFSYEFLMNPARNYAGRRLFGPEELRLLHQALLSQDLFCQSATMVKNMERDFAQAYGVPYAVASTSGTAAIHAALGALDLNPGDEVITAPITDLGTIIPILCQNAIPVFSDIDDTYNMDPADLERKITSRTKAIIAVHLFGNPCDMDAMVRIVKKYNICLIEDCAQAHMTEYKGRYVGTIADIGCFSFQQSKHMTTGDGGMTITSNKAYYEKMKLFVDKNYARKGWGARAYYGLAPNYRMNELTGAVGLAQLRKVKAVIEKRYELGEYLTRLLLDVEGIKTAPVTEGAKHSYWLYPLYLEDIDINVFAQEMKKEKIGVSAGYTVKPIYLCAESLTAKKTYGNSGCPFTCKFTDKIYEYKEGLCPKAEDALKHLICIPLDESWNKEKVEKTASTILRCIKRLKGDVTIEKPGELKETHKIVSIKETKKINIAVIGCGNIGRWHIDAYNNNPTVRISAFVDKDITKAIGYASKFNVKAYDSHKAMLKEQIPEGASICTIPSTHRDIAMDLLEAGVHLLCEKPLAISVLQAEEMTKKAAEKKLILLTAYKFRFFEEVNNAKEILAQGGLGRIMNFRLMFGGYLDMSASWFSNREFSGGGVIMDNGSHAIDLIRYILGEIKSVSAQTENFQNLNVEDTAKMLITLQKGGCGTVDISWSQAVPAPAYLEIYGEDGMIMLDFNGLAYKFKTWKDWKRINNLTNIKEGFNRQINHFTDSILSKNPSIITNDDGLKSQLLIEAAYEALRRKGEYAA